MNDKVGIKGSITILKYENEKLIEEKYFENLITDSGLNYLLQLVGNDVTGGINKLALGNGTNPAVKSDIQLQSKLLLADVQRDYSVPGRVNFMTNIPANTFSSTVFYNEAGLTYKTSSVETLISRVVFGEAVFQKPENSITFLYSLEIRV